MRSTLPLFLAFLLFATASAAAPLRVDSYTDQYAVALHADVLEDKTGSLSIDQVSSKEYKGQWVKNQEVTPNFSFSKSVYWLRVEVVSDIDKPKTWWFEIAFPLQDYIDYYVLDGREVREKVLTGDRRPFDSRSFDYRNFLFELEVPPRGSRQVFLRLDTNDGLHEPLPLILWDQQSFAFANGLRNLGLGFYFGVMLVMALYNLFIYLSVRDKAYIYYVAYIASFSAWLFTYYGFSYQYLWPKSPLWANQSIIVLTAIWAIFMLQFARKFLDTKRLVPWFEPVSVVYTVCMLLTILSTFSENYSLGILLVVCIGSLGWVAGVASAVSSLRANYRPARYFLLAWTALLVAIMIFCLKIAGLVEPSWGVERSVQIGSVVEVILLSLGMADRINMLKKEKIQAKEEAIQAFESSMALKNNFITSISHELRTPMNAILGGVQMLRQELHERGVPSWDESTLGVSSLDIVEAGANDMMSLVDHILIQTEIQTGQLSCQSTNFSLRLLVDSLSKSYIPLCEQKGLDVELRLDRSVPDWIFTDQKKLIIILSNLLGNAIKFTEKGRVTLGITCDLDSSPMQLECTVTDTGLGIANDHQDTVFEPFLQVDGGFKRRHTGMGIGLSVCRILTSTLKGALTLESTVGKGSAFTLRFPIELGGSPLQGEDNHLAPSDLPILVVEDNIVNQKIILKMLKTLGYKTLLANQGEEALAILENDPVALILMDLQMPIMDGFSCANAIRSRNDHVKNVPIIAVTANIMDADKKRCLDCGMNEFMAKPISLVGLRDCLSLYMEPQ